MTTLYELVAGQNAYAKMALAIINLDQNQIARYRDSTLFNPDKEHDFWRVAVLARSGGPNRTHFDMSALESHPLFLSTEDMKADPTYALYEFSFPKELVGLGNWILRTEQLEGDERIDAWVSLFNKLNKLKEAFPQSPYVLSMKKWIAPVIQQLVDSGKIEVQEV